MLYVILLKEFNLTSILIKPAGKIFPFKLVKKLSLLLIFKSMDSHLCVFKKVIPLFFLVIINYPSFCQFYNTGSAPAKVRWKQIKTPTATVIFPSES